MIGQYLSNTNERATVSILQNILKLNNALMTLPGNAVPAAVFREPRKSRT